MPRRHDHRGNPWLDEDGAFVFGKYAGEEASTVAKSDPSYIRWILDTQTIDRQDKEQLTYLLLHRGQI